MSRSQASFRKEFTKSLSRSMACRLPVFELVRQGGIGQLVADVPHLGEQGDIRAHLPGHAAVLLAFGLVGGLVITGGEQLKQGDFLSLLIFA